MGLVVAHHHVGGALGFDMLYAKPRYRATFNTEDEGLVSVRHEMSVYSGQFNGTWNLMEGSFTPYLQLGAGWTYVDSNVSDGPPVTGCWWDPWWGYICISDWRTYETSEFSYNLGLGVRWDINNAVFTRAAYSREYLSLDNGTLNFDMLTLEMGLMF